MLEIIKRIEKLSPYEGKNTTAIPGVRTYKYSENTSKAPLVYNQGIIFLSQGTKRVFLQNKTYEYNCNNFLIITLPLPLECEALPDNGKPLLGLLIDIDIHLLNKIIDTMGEDINPINLDRSAKNVGLFTTKSNNKIKDTILRLLVALENPTEAKVLGKDILKELYFRLMCSENASSLYALAMRNTKLSKIDIALKEIHNNYQSSIDVSRLARMANMSLSSFHHTFKDFTGSSPIQYLKKVRLSKARDILITNRCRVSEAAESVGYESMTQFSREFKRYFNQTANSVLAINLS